MPMPTTGFFRGYAPATQPAYPAERVTVAVRIIHVLDDLLGLALSYFIVVLLRFGFDADRFFDIIGSYVDSAAVHLGFANPALGSDLAQSTAQYAVTYAHRAPIYIAAFFLFLFTAYSLLGMYGGHRRLRRTPLLWNLILANGAGFLILAAVLFFRHNTWHMRAFLPLVLIVNVFTTYAVRVATNRFITRFRTRNGKFLYHALLIGKGKEADHLQTRSDERRMKGFRIVRRIETPASLAEALEKVPPLLKGVSVLFVVDAGLSHEMWEALVRTAFFANRDLIVYSPRFLTLHNPFQHGDLLNGTPLVHYSAPGSAVPESRFRAFVSAALAAAAIIVLSPVLLLISLGIKLDSPGPVLFRQKRYGKDCRPFEMFKFRTMVQDAESHLAELRNRNETDGALFKLHDDPRVTKFGRFLRRTSLDELPQLLNILRGEMRFVGPRPLPCADLDPYLDQWQGVRQLVKPGITCIWQCSGRSDVGFDSMANLDAWYVFNRSWVLDIQIIFRTLWTVLFGAGAY